MPPSVGLSLARKGSVSSTDDNHSLAQSEISETSEKPVYPSPNANNRYPSMDAVTKLFKKLPKPFKGKKKEREVVISPPTLLDGKGHSETLSPEKPGP
jgi:hypothetical protein